MSLSKRRIDLFSSFMIKGYSKDVKYRPCSFFFKRNQILNFYYISKTADLVFHYYYQPTGE